MKRAQHAADRKFLLVVATIVLLSVLLSSNYSYATESTASAGNAVLQRATGEEIQITNEPIAVAEPRVPRTASALELDYLQTELRSHTALTAEDLDETFAGTGLSGLGAAFKEAEARHDVNAATLAALAIHESAWGASAYARNRNNLFGFSAYTENPDAAKDFASPEACVLHVASFLDEHYLQEDGKYYRGGTLTDINPIYAADPRWKDKIALIWERLENGYFAH